TVWRDPHDLTGAPVSVRLVATDVDAVRATGAGERHEQAAIRSEGETARVDQAGHELLDGHGAGDLGAGLLGGGAVVGRCCCKRWSGLQPDQSRGRRKETAFVVRA